MISVCMATHNGEKYIKQQLTSILSQIGENDEVVISDDGSTDNTLDIIHGFHDKRLRVFNYKQQNKTKHAHEYVTKNFENALCHANGDYIFLSDQDDEWMPNKVEVCLSDLKKHDLVLHEFTHVNAYEEVIKELHYNGKFRPHNFLLRTGKHYGCAMAFRRSVLDYALPFPKYLLLHDYWIGILSELLGDFYLEERPLIRYRIHQQNTSENHNPLWFMIYYRMHTFFNVVCRITKYKLGKHHYLKN